MRQAREIPATAYAGYKACPFKEIGLEPNRQYGSVFALVEGKWLAVRHTTSKFVVFTTGGKLSPAKIRKTKVCVNGVTIYNG